MPGQGRLGDCASAQQDAHGCPACPHPALGPAIRGSDNVNVNGRPALRVDDIGMHAPCCGPNLWTATEGSASVFINGKPAFRAGDPSRHCGGDGKLQQGSSDVIVGGSSSGGGGGGSSSSGGGGSSSSGGAGGGGGAASSASGAASSSASGASSSSGGGSSSGASSSKVRKDAAPQAGAPAPGSASKTHWAEVCLVDGTGAPIAGAAVSLVGSDGARRAATTRANGIARWEGLPPGDARVQLDDSRHRVEEKE